MIKHSMLLMVTCASATLAQASPRSDLPSASFTYKDWELACDNTRTCRAAGYNGTASRRGATVLLSRAAGARQAVRAELQLAQGQGPLPSSVQMVVAGQALGKVTIAPRTRTGTLSTAQVAALLPALLGTAAIAWTGGRDSWTISSGGATAVLLKMDEFQDRLDTPGALVRKGDRLESTVLPALPLPVIKAAPAANRNASLSTTPAEHQAMMQALAATVAGQDCDVVTQPDPRRDHLQVLALAPGKILLSHRCWSGAYNEGKGFWVANARAPYEPVLVTNKGSSYAAGRIDSVQLGRGVGDCAARASWTWDGRSFAQSSALSTGMCRGIKAGGAWSLPTLVTRIERPQN